MAGNWKMNLNHLEAIALVQKLAFSLNDKDFDQVEVAVLPPFIGLRSVQTMVDGDRLRLVYGGQDLSPYDNGARTGDISGSMLKALGCTYVVVGHSERRTDHGETDALVRSKVLAAGRHGLVPILCVGEGLDVRRAGQHITHCVGQLTAALVDVPEAVLNTLVVAYEPVWAIGTGEVATPEDAQEGCAALRATVADVAGSGVADAVRVLYGGSVKASNVAAIMAMPDVDGGLVGGASLDAVEFAKIARFPSLNAD
jgi:triosephosphate isomerase